MNLQPDPKSPGLWANLDWKPGQPGTFALVIGNSRYHHLPGGDLDLARRTFDPARSADWVGFGQLEVSARTAFSFFCWLRDSFRRSESPLARCWLLLGPVASELNNIDPSVLKSSVDPTHQACLDAIGGWYRVMEGLPQPNAEKSRSFFFFSGHGLEVIDSYQILLPSDYLRPPLESVELAVSSLNLMKGLKALAVPQHFFFLDACRNDVGEMLSNRPIEGTRALPEPENDPNKARGTSYVHLFYAAASGSQAFQHPQFAQSLFGKALLEGLRGEGIRPDYAANRCTITVHLLDYFLKNRVLQLASSLHGSQRYVLGGGPIDTHAVVTEVDPPVANPPKVPTRDELANALYSVKNRVKDWRAVVRDGGRLHALLGSKDMTDIWTANTTIFDVDRREPRPLPRDLFEIHEIDRNPEARAFRIALSLPGPGRRYWFQLVDPLRSFGCYLLAENTKRTHYLMELDLEFRSADWPRHLSRVEINLSAANEVPLRDAGVLWSMYQHDDIERAANFADKGFLEKMLRPEGGSPLGAIVAILVLMRVRRWEQLGEAPERMVASFPTIPDGYVLKAEDLLRRRGRKPRVAEAANSLEQLGVLGLPLTGEALGYALKQLDFLLYPMIFEEGNPIDGRQRERLGQLPERFMRGEHPMFREGNSIDERQRERLEQLQERLLHALKFLRRGGLFCVFAGNKDLLSPRLILPLSPQLDKGGG
jgi:hypothetical protein